MVKLWRAIPSRLNVWHPSPRRRYDRSPSHHPARSDHAGVPHAARRPPGRHRRRRRQRARVVRLRTLRLLRPQIGTHFFPAHNPTASLLAAFGTFAAGFIMRPLGGALFGWVGDKFGRKQALLWSVMAMAFPSFFIGVLPSTETIGIPAPILLLTFRLIQGIAVGGEYMASAVFLVEGAEPDGRSGRARIQGPLSAQRGAAQNVVTRGVPLERSGGPRFRNWRGQGSRNSPLRTVWPPSGAHWTPGHQSAASPWRVAGANPRDSGRDPAGRCGARINMMDPTPRSRGSGRGKVLRVVSLVGGTGAIAR